MHIASPHSADLFRSALHTSPRCMGEIEHGGGVFVWDSPAIDGFVVPQNDELVIALHLGGSQQVRNLGDDGPSRTCSSNGLVTLLPPGRAAAFRTDGSFRFVSQHVPQRLLSNLEFFEKPRFAFADPFIRAGLDALRRAVESGSATREYLTAMTQALLAHLEWLGRSAIEGPTALTDPRRIGRRTLGEFLAWIDRRLGGHLDLERLAAEVGRSRAAFTREFRALVGCSPHQYLSDRRIAAAQAMLVGTDHDLARIAQETGFSSQSHFTAQFRARTGVTPGRFRADRRQT